MSSTASTAHLPMAMLASAIGASTRAVAALHLSTAVLDAAPAPRARPEGLEGAQKLLRGEVRPQRFRNVELGVGYLPEQKVRDTQLTAGPYHQVDLGYVRGVEISGEGYLVDILRRETVGEDPASGVHDLRPPPVIEGDVDIEAVVVRGEILGFLHSFEHRSRQMLPSAQETEPGSAFVQLRNLLTGRVQKELHEGLNLPLRTPPVLGRESIEG